MQQQQQKEKRKDHAIRQAAIKSPVFLRYLTHEKLTAEQN